jgi:nicotinamide-nucleotide amidase
MKEVNASIITIGDELLIGQTIDTNSAFIAQSLNRIGIWVKKRIAVGDVKQDILAALTEQGNESDLVIITGGLGPTADDITKPTLCEFFKCGTRIDENARRNVIDIFTRLKRPVTERNLTQAEVPDACLVLPNKRGTAPGMWFYSAEKNCIYISLPGVPNEMKGLMTDSVIPALEEKLELPGIAHRTILTSGVGESVIADEILEFENSLPENIKLAYLPAYGLVRLRLTCRSGDKTVADKEVDSYFQKLKPLVSEWMVAEEDIPIEAALTKFLKSKNATLSTAESCTGGYIAHLITSLAGSSAVYKGSVVSYANEAKENLLGVNQNTIQKHGAVSEETVTGMLNGALKTLKTDYAIATSGIMGPDGGSAEKPVGTVWIAVGSTRKIQARKVFFRYDRERNIEMTANTALTMLYRFIKEEKDDSAD